MSGNSQKINEFVDWSALEAEKQRLIKEMSDTISQLQKMGGKVSFGGGDTKTIPEATKVIGEYNKQYEKTIQLTGQLNNLKSQEGQVEEKLQQAQKEGIKTTKLQAAATNELTGAWERARAKGQLLDKHARDLAFSMYEMEKAGKKGTAEYQKLETEFNKVSQEAFDFNAEIKKVDATINIHSKNVGNYDGAITSLRQEIKNMTQTLATMELQGKGNTKQYDDMVRKLGQLKDAVGDVQARSKFWADDARYVNTAVQAVQGLVGAYSVYVGVTEIVGEKNEELEKIMRKMMALMTVMQGLQQVANMLNKDSYVRVAANVAIEKVRAYWTGVQTAATGAGTIAQRAFNAAVKANPIGLLVTVVIAAVAALIAYGRHVSEVTKIENEWIGANSEIKKKYAEQKQGIETYLSIAKNVNKSDEQRILALKKLREETGGIVTATDLSSASLKKLDEQTNIYLTTLYKQIKLEAAREKLIEIQKNTFDLQAESMKITNEVYDKNITQLTASLNPLDAAKMGFASIADLLKGNVVDAYKRVADFRTKDINEQIKQNAILEKGLLNYVNENTILTDNTKAKGENTKATKDLTGASHEFYKEIESLYDLLDKSIASKDSKFLDLRPQLEKQFKHIKEFNDLVLQNLGASEAEKTAALLSNEEVRYAEELLRLGDNFKAIEEATKIHVDNVNAIKNGNEIKPPKGKEDGSPYDWKDYFNAIGSGAADTLGGISDLMDDLMQKELSNFKTVQDDKLRVLNEQLRLGILTEEEYIADKSDLEIEFDEKKKELEKEQFKRTKAMAYAEAVINGALAAVEALNAKTTAMMIIKLAFVASALSLQLAKIQAQTPGFEKGRKDEPGTFAKVGEGGWEFTGDGSNIFKTPNSTTLTYLKPHQWVMPHAESVQLEKILGTPTVNQITTQKPQAQDKELINAINKLAKKPTVINHMDAHGIRVALYDGANSMNFVNNHILFKN